MWLPLGALDSSQTGRQRAKTEGACMGQELNIHKRGKQEGKRFKMTNGKDEDEFTWHSEKAGELRLWLKKCTKRTNT